jgi:hypothetical protein
MTTETEVKWEDVTFEDLREGDEVEYLNTGEHQEHRFWGKVLAKYADNMHLEGDWHLVKSSWKHIGDKGHIRRKVAPIKFPTRTGAVISFAYRNGDTEQVTTYVRADNRDTGYFWVETTSGERYAEWEVELVQSNATLTVISDGS